MTIARSSQKKLAERIKLWEEHFVYRYVHNASFRETKTTKAVRGLGQSQATLYVHYWSVSLSRGGNCALTSVTNHDAAPYASVDEW